MHISRSSVSRFFSGKSKNTASSTEQPAHNEGRLESDSVESSPPQIHGYTREVVRASPLPDPQILSNTVAPLLATVTTRTPPSHISHFRQQLDHAIRTGLGDREVLTSGQHSALLEQLEAGRRSMGEVGYGVALRTVIDHSPQVAMNADLRDKISNIGHPQARVAAQEQFDRKLSPN